MYDPDASMGHFHIKKYQGVNEQACGRNCPDLCEQIIGAC